MADMLNKTSMFSSCPYTENRISQFLESSFGVGAVKLNSWCLSKKMVVQENAFGFSRKGSAPFLVKAQVKLGYMKAQKWWEKGLQPNMREVTSAQDLVDTLWRAGDSLVVVNFFSPGCGGCKALHPKVCQIAEMNPEVQFLEVNYEEHKSMCYSLNVHVLPFFRFYRGAHGRLCSFSCTNATIHKFRAALAKHTPDRCSLSPTKGLEEKELLQLADNRELSFQYTSQSVPTQHVIEQEEIMAKASRTLPPLPKSNIIVPCPSYTAQESNDRSLVASQR